jgi:hypothetical protein
MFHIVRLSLAVVVVALFTSQAGALAIQRVEPDGSLADFDATITYGDRDIQVDLDKEFKSSEMIGHSLNLQFTCEAADVGKEIWISEQVTNQTGATWTAFEMVLLNQGPFVPGNANAAFTSSTPTSTRFSSVDQTSSDLYFYDGTVPDLTPVAVSTVGFSDIHISHNTGVGMIFNLKEIPTPEPMTLSLLAAGAGLLLKRRKA